MILPSGPIIRLCGCCGTEHDISERSFCPAYGSKCAVCGKENHWRKVCRSSKSDKKGKNKHGRQKLPFKREMLAVLFGLEKSHYYAYGRHVVVESDCKPLEAIFKKHLSSAPPSIARMMLCIQKYDAEIKYAPGKDIPVADALSRNSSRYGEAVQGLDVSVHEVHLHLNASPTRGSQIREETDKDTTLSALREIIMHGWPEKRSDCPAYLHRY